MIVNSLSQTISLDGEWEFSLEEPGCGGRIFVPGCWEAQGYSKIVEGPAFYKRQVFIPKDWQGEEIFIEFDAASYACKVSINGRMVGEHFGMWTPFAFDISGPAKPGEQNLIEVEIYKPGKRYPMRSSLAGFLPDIATTFGGLWQPARLRALRTGIKDLQIEPDPHQGKVSVHCKAVILRQMLEQPEWKLQVFTGGELVTEACGPYHPNGLDMTLEVPSMRLWSPQDPVLYELRLSLMDRDLEVAVTAQRFGFRWLSKKDDVLLFNGKPAILRGILSWGWQPEKITPAYSRDQLKEEIIQVKLQGYNLIKLCLFVPDPGFFEVADEEGIFLWEEFPMWLPEVNDDLRQRAPGEYINILQITRPHPSVVMYSLGCELNRSVNAEFLGSLDRLVRASSNNVLICDNSGSGESYGGLDIDFSDFSDYHPYYELQYFESLLDNWRRDWQPPRPWIFGEFSDSDGFRDIDELIATNHGEKPWWMTAENPVTTWRPEAQAMVEVQERLERANLGISTARLVEIANHQSLMVRKFALETLRRRKGMGGYVVTGLRDTPITTSGIFDDFGRPKWQAEEFSTFNADSILCLETIRRRRWQHGGDRPDVVDRFNHWAGETAQWHVILSSFGSTFEKGDEFHWSLHDHLGNLLEQGQSGVDSEIRAGIPCEAGSISVELPDFSRARELRLEASLIHGKNRISNSWPVWVYPRLTWQEGAGLYDPSSSLDNMKEMVDKLQRLDDASAWETPLVIATGWCSALESYLRNGGKVLLLQQGNYPLPSRNGPFWREGLKLLIDHPIWKSFPNRGWADLQFFGMASDILLDSEQVTRQFRDITGIRPILRRLDEREFTVSEYLYEASYGRGILIACSLLLNCGAGSQPNGLKRNAAGATMLSTLIHYLTTLNDH